MTINYQQRSLTSIKTKYCSICNHTNFLKLYTINSYSIIECKNCGIIFVDFQLEEDQIGEFLSRLYSQEYFTGGKSNITSEKVGYSENYFICKRNEVTRNAHHRIKKIEKLIPRKGTLLDVGCAAGFFLKVAQEKGWTCSGLEISKDAANFAIEELKIPVIVDTLENANIPECSFDVVTSWDVIEHLFNPQLFIENSYKILKPGGLLVIGTPNIGSLAYKLRKEKWYHFKPPEHLFYYNKESLNCLLQKKFEIVRIVDEYPPYSAIKPEIKAIFQRILYTGFNIVSKIFHNQEYLIGYARKKN